MRALTALLVLGLTLVLVRGNKAAHGLVQTTGGTAASTEGLHSGDNASRAAQYDGETVSAAAAYDEGTGDGAADQQKDTVPAAVLYALVSALSTARGDTLHADAVYHLHLTGGRRPEVDSVRVSRLPPAPTGHRGQTADGGRARPTAAGNSSPPAAAGQQAAPLAEYSAGQMYFTPRMLYVGDDSTERTVSRGSRSSRRSDRARRTRASSRRPRTARRDSRQAGWGPPELRRPPSPPAADPGYSTAERYDPQYETECPRTPHDPDGDCIKGEAGTDYPTLDTIPRTGFSCRGRPAGYYADEETRCQVWHYCSTTHVRQSFLCTRGTVFNQLHLVCDWWYAVECGRSDSFHYVNNRLYGAAERAEEPSDDLGRQEYSSYTGYGARRARYQRQGQEQERIGTDRARDENGDREERELQARERDVRERAERQRDERGELQDREREAREREERGRDIKEREERGREISERTAAREREARERETKEREDREQEARVRAAREREQRELEARKQKARERDIREREAARERHTPHGGGRCGPAVGAADAGSPCPAPTRQQGTWWAHRDR
ncbi:uncharacterized protein LOC122383487 [Amphibalanus amphitrite]|uniref:uncharacterized protein LOC122383487 n=1 Tax=Amphibalanus amphitrite TaxID=1232801 RepID=UPI001C9164D8|nr:uncharacterized protein LOC122383487 [Amphibalanus amphitrite]